MRTKRTQTRQEEIASGCTVVPVPSSLTATSSSSDCISSTGANLRNKPLSSAMLKRSAVSAAAACRESSPAKVLRKPATIGSSTNVTKSESNITTSEIDKKSGNAKPIQSISIGKDVKDTVSDKKGKKVIKPSDSDKVSMPKVKKLTKKDILKNKQIAAKALAAVAAATIAANVTTETSSSTSIAGETDEKPPSSPKDEKVSKELKNLDIQITGYNSVLKCDSNTSASDIIIKASISEIVKTKSRTSASQSIYGKSATMAAISNSLINNTSAGGGAITNDNKPIIKSNPDIEVEQTAKQDESKSDNDTIKPTISSTKKGKLNRRNVAALKKKAINDKKKDSEKPQQQQIKSSADEPEKSLNASKKKRTNAEKTLPKNKKQKIVPTKEPIEGQMNITSDSITESNLMDIQSLPGVILDNIGQNTEAIKLTEEIDFLKEIEKDTATKSKPAKKNAKTKAPVKKVVKNELPPKEDIVESHNVVENVVETSQEEVSTEKLTKKSTKPAAKPIGAKKKLVKAPLTKKSKCSETVVNPNVNVTSSEAITETINPEPQDSVPVAEHLKDTIMQTQSNRESSTSSPKHQKSTKISLSKQSTLKKQQKPVSIDDATKSKIKIACPKKKVLKALKITEEEQDKGELNIGSEPIDCDSEPSDIVIIPPTNEIIPFESPSTLELTEDTSSMPLIENLASSPDNPSTHILPTGQLSDFISKPKQFPEGSQSNIKKMVEDILQVLEMSDEFSGNETGGKKLPPMLDENPPEEEEVEEDEELNTIKNSKVLKSKANKAPKAKTKKPMANKNTTDSVIPQESTTTEVEPPKEDVSSDEPLSELVKPETKSDAKLDNLGTSALSNEKEIEDEEEEELKKLKTIKPTSSKKIPMVGKSQIVKRKYVRRKPKSPTALQKMVDKAVKRNQKLTLTEAEISSLDCVDDYSRTKDIYDFHESGHSSEDTSLSYKKNIKKDSKVNELKFDFDSKDPLEIFDKSSVKTEAKLNAEMSKEIAVETKQLKETKVKKELSSIKPAKKIKETKSTKSAKKSAAEIKKKDVSHKAAKKKKSQSKSDKNTQSTSDSEPISKKKMTTDKETKSKTKQAQAKKAKQKKIPTKKSRSKFSSNESDSEDDESSDGDEVLAKKYYKTKHLTSSTTNTSESDSGSCTSVRTRVNKRRKSAVKNRRMRLFGFYSGPKRHRMASLNALAKVQCLYENESRTAQELGFVREPRVVPKLTSVKHRAPVVIVPNENDDGSDSNNENAIDEDVESGKKKLIPKDPLSETDVKVECEVIGSRSLRTAPGIRGAGKLWEMGNMSSMESNTGGESDESYEQVSLS